MVRLLGRSERIKEETIMTNIEKLQQAINILAGLNARVDQVNTIVVPAVNVMNILTEVRNSLKMEEDKKKEEQTEK